MTILRSSPALAVAVTALAAAAVIFDGGAKGSAEGQDSSQAPASGDPDERGPSPPGNGPKSGGGDPLRSAGLSPEVRRAALAAAAKSSGRSEIDELIDSIVQCGNCPARSDLGLLLADWDAGVLAEPKVMERLVSIAGGDGPEPARVAAARAINAVPESNRPESAKPFAAKRVEIVCVPGQMRWEPKEFSVPAGSVVEIRMRNDDTMQHNLLVIAPGSLSEIGIAADRMGETLEGKARQYVPDSPKVLHVMGLIDPHETGVLWFIAPTRTGTYPLVCTYPGHWRMMNGKMRVTKSGQ